VSAHELGIIISLAGVIGACRLWFLRSDRHITRTVDESIRGGRFTGNSEQDRPQMIRKLRRFYALVIGLSLLVALVGIAILVKSSAG
jgi:hypothetical protein